MQTNDKKGAATKSIPDILTVCKKMPTEELARFLSNAQIMLKEIKSKKRDRNRQEEKERREKEKKEKAEKNMAIQKIREEAKKHGITVEIKPIRTGGRQKGSVMEKKYANPDNPSETWAGFGRKPKWLEEHLGKGGSLDQCKAETALRHASDGVASPMRTGRRHDDVQLPVETAMPNDNL